MIVECQGCEQVFDTLAAHSVHLKVCEGARRKEVRMDTIIVNMGLLKETKNTYRYEAEEGSAVTSLYVHKVAMQGKAPQVIKVTVEAETHG